MVYSEINEIACTKIHNPIYDIIRVVPQLRENLAASITSLSA